MVGESRDKFPLKSTVMPQIAFQKAISTSHLNKPVIFSKIGWCELCFLFLASQRVKLGTHMLEVRALELNQFSKK